MTVSENKPVLFVISGPSGSGKKTLMRHIINHFPEIKHVPTYTTRPKRPDEDKNVDYIYVDGKKFRELTKSGEIFEYTRTYGDHYYGSPKSLLVGDQDQNLIVELDYKGMFRVRASSSLHVVSIYVMPLDLKTLITRIERRSQEQNLDSRMAVANEQLQFAWAYDYIIINDKLEVFLENASHIISAELLRKQGKNYLIAKRHIFDQTLIDDNK